MNRESSTEVRLNGDRSVAVLLSRGVRHSESLLLDTIEEARPSLADLQTPLRIVVPSEGLRRHLSARLVAERRRAWVGLKVDSLRTLASEILSHFGMAKRYDIPLPLLVEREMLREPSLSSIPGQASGSIAATVRDLLDSGLDESHSEALLGLLGQSMAGIADSERRRAQGLVKVALRVRTILDRESFRLDGLDLQMAAECLARYREGRPFPCRSVIVFGFSDVTGSAGELLAQALRTFGGQSIVDLPPTPGNQAIAESAFPQDWLERLSSFSPPQYLDDREPPTELDLLVGGEPWIEIRAIAKRVRLELEAGVQPEEIAIVFRDPEAYRLELRRQLERLGIPFSADGIAGPCSGSWRPWRAMLDLIDGGDKASSERWLTCLHVSEHSPREAILALAIRVLGAGRLTELASIAEPVRDLALPIRRGLVSDENGEPQSPRIQLAREDLDRMRSLAKGTCSLLEDWTEKAPFATHLRSFGELAGLLGWAAMPHDLLISLAESAPRGLEISRNEFRKLAEGVLSRFLTEPLGGRGGGVQILTVMEARSRRFSRLFVAGMNRGAFPRPVKEDPLLSDSLRKAIRVLLPDLPVKSLGHDEDRYLFAQLLTASPRTTLSWSHRIDSKEQLPSPLIESLLRVRPELQVRAADSPLRGPDQADLRPFEEHLMASALSADRDLLALDLPAAWPHLYGELPNAGPPPGAVTGAPRGAMARIDLLAALDLPPYRRSTAHPSLGFLGPVRRPADPRRRLLPVTTIEGLTSCPWQSFLTRLLRLEPTPDPLASLPALDPLKVGSVVHGTLEALFHRAAPHEKQSGFISWPTALQLEELAFEQAARLLAQEGSTLSGLARGLARLALPYLEVARQIDWPEGTSRYSILEVEPGGQVVPDPSSGDAALSFRADRIDRKTVFDSQKGGLLRTDYKTGKPLSSAKRETTRREHLFKAILQGRSLQIVAYCLAGDPQPATGRLLFLGDGLEDELRSVEVGSEDLEMVAAYRDSVAAAYNAIRNGTFFPRLVGPDGRTEPPRCKSCSVRDACSRGDSGMRRELLGIVEKTRERVLDSPGKDPLFDLWMLPDRRELRT